MLTKNKLLQNLVRFPLLVLASFLLFSCTDSGCIDADDFGEYETQTIVVSANAGQDSCSYDASVSLTDSTQGSGIKSCLTQGTTTVYDAEGNSQNTETGCDGLSEYPIFQTICISSCVQTCLSSSSSDSSGSEPAWNSNDKKGVGQNSGVTIRPGSQIMVRASGSISLGSYIEYPSIYLKANDPLPHSYNSSFVENFFDVRSGQSITASFSGLVYHGPDNTLPLGQTSENEAKYLYNLSKRLVIYTIPHPEGYGGFDLNQDTEKEGVKTVPLLPDPQVWQCSYSGTGEANLLQSDCGNSSDGYTGKGYLNVNNESANSAFPVSSASQSSTLTEYGGFIRWNNDGLNIGTYDPFVNLVTCSGTTGICTNIANVSGDQGQIIGDLSSVTREITNTYSDAFKVSLRSLTGDNGCNLNPLVVSVLDSEGNSTNQTYNLSVIHTDWTNPIISLEPGQKLRINQNTTKYNTTGVNCGKVIGIRFLKYQDLIIEKSGFLRFAILGETGSSGSCVIKGRIINPEGSYVDASTTYTADFYEYSATSNPADPMSSGVVVPVLTNGSSVLSWTPGTSTSVAQIYLRKGQKIRFDPDSWNGVWTSNAGLRQCGIGMAMKIDPRPALLCRGVATEKMPNPNCIPDVDSSGTLIGCKATATECSNEVDTTYYCAHSDCMDTISCATDGSSPDYQKAECAFTSSSRAYESSTCVGLISNQYTGSEEVKQESDAKNRCRECSDRMLNKATLAAMVDVDNIDQCYDLEEYQGKVENIPLSASSTSDSNEAAVNDFLNNSSRAKGAIKLNGFNGDYGNITSYSDTGKLDPLRKKIYSVYSQYLINSDSRLRVIMLENDNVNNDIWSGYSDNTNGSTRYNGSNGIKIDLQGGLEFNNGEWMRVQLCQETSNDGGTSYKCKSVSSSGPENFATVANQPQIVNITSPSDSTPAGSSPELTGNYAFDASGNLFKRTGSTTGDCTLEIHGIQSSVGSMFYCHTYEYYSEADFEDRTQDNQDKSTDNIEKLRLTFKILDPEIPNCDINSTGTNDGIKLDNPYYDSEADNVGETCSSSEAPGPDSTACKKQFYCANKYANNSGEYYVTIKTKSTSISSVSSVISAVVKPVIEVMDGKQDDPKTSDKDESTIGQSERIYKLLIADPRYKAILSVSLVVMITFWGVGYLLGVSELNQTEIITRVFKIGFVYLMVGETGWEWFQMFFVSFFKEGTDYLSFMMAASFDESPELAAAIGSGDLYDKSVLFTSVDNVFNLFFSSAVQKKIYALFFASIFGWAYCLIILWSFMHYVIAVANAVLLYLTAQVFISIMFVVGPIFFVFLLFSQTKDMFDNWLKQLIGFSLQQIFLLITLAFFNMLMYEVIKMSLGYKVCWDEVWVMNLGLTRVSLMSFWTISSLPPRTNANSQVGNIGNPEGIPSIFTILFIWVISSLMKQFIGFMTDMAASISGGLSASAMSKGISDAAAAVSKAAGQAAKEFDKEFGIYDKTVGRMDDKLFDHGKAADARRAAKTKEDASVSSNARGAIAAGKAAASKYRAETGDSSAAGSAEAAKKGQKDYLASKGITGEKADKILNSKGAKIGGARDIPGALYNAVKNRGTFSQSAAEQAAGESGKLSGKEFKSLMKNSTPEQRKDHLEKHNSGEMQLDRSAGQAYDGKTSLIKLNPFGEGKGLVNEALNFGASVAIKATTGIDVNPAKEMSNILSGGDKDRKEAKDQLTQEGSITKLSTVGEMFRDKEESKLLDKRTSEIKADKKIVANKAPTERENQLAKLDADNAEAIDEIDASSSPVLGAIRKAGQEFTTFAKKINLNPYPENRKSSSEILKNQMNKDIAVNNGEINELGIARERAMKEVNKNKGAVNSKKIEIGELVEKSKQEKNPVTLKRINSQIKAAQKDLYGSQVYKDHRKATVAVHQLDSKIKNKQKKGDEMQEIFNNIESGEAAAEGNKGLENSFKYLETPDDFKRFSEQHRAPKEDPIGKNPVPESNPVKKD